jgi:biotin carboxyl carrier protein
MRNLRITVLGQSYDLTVETLGESVSTAMAPVTSSIAKPQAPVAVSAATAKPLPGGIGDVISPMAGMVLNIKVKEGDVVKAGDIVVILEAMKMETPIPSPIDGTVLKINISTSTAVQQGQVLISLG